MIKKLIKLLVALLILVAIVLAAVHIYFNTGDEAPNVNQGNAPVQANASANADSISNDLASLLELKDGAQFSAQIIRTIEDAKDSVKAGKAEAGKEYLEKAREFVTEHESEIKSLEGLDHGIVEWFVNAPAEELLQDI